VPRFSRFLAIAVLLAAAAPSTAAGFGMRPYALTVHSGSMRLDFHGDAAAGCEEIGVCSTSGTVTSTTRATTTGTGFLDLFGGSFHGRATGPASGKSLAVVRTPGAPDCTDTVERRGHAFTLMAGRRGPVWAGFGTTLSLKGETGPTEVAWEGSEGIHEPDRIFETHCAGPRFEDFAEAFAAVKVPRSVIRERWFSFRLTGERPFVGGGFAGTVTTDLRVTLRRTRCSARERKLCRAYDRQARS
jgi:hypothetical protein